MAESAARRVALLRRLAAAGAVRVEHTIHLEGGYAEDDGRRRHRVVVAGIGALRTFSGGSEEEALEAAAESTREAAAE
jgi:hypothetical protein